MIEVINLEKQYFAPNGNHVTVLSVDRLIINPAQHTALVGPSGSGKSTILSMIGGMVTPTSGDMFWNGKPWPGRPGELTARERARRVGFVFQELNLLPSLSLFDNLVAACWFLGLQHPESLVREALKWVGLSDQSEARPECLSRGERQRAAVARAIIYPHTLILADEPTASLDEANAELVMDLLIGKAAENGSALLVATHDPRVVDKLPHTYDLLEHSAGSSEKQKQSCGGNGACCVS
ncbi:MAG: ATP-binding cassette domain-containing protein [Planctomycetaceae bacterium]|nr:ATP-binding cassette domain-containing protein [Planctomycetaceae bacterium]